MTLKELEQKRREKGYTFKQISELSGLPEETVICALGRMEFPGYEVMKALEKVLTQPDRPDMIREALPKYAGDMRLYTIEDYYAISEERRVELIDGVIYDMASPSFAHQVIIMSIAVVIQNYIKKKKGRCKVLAAAVDVQLDCDNKTMVQPDIVVLCDKKKNVERCIMGAPDFVVEVLSKSTRKKDMTMKLEKYRKAGVREYWMIDLKNETVIVHEFEKGDIPAIYGFDSKVPVGIFQGDLEIDFVSVKMDLEWEN